MSPAFLAAHQAWLTAQRQIVTTATGFGLAGTARKVGNFGLEDELSAGLLTPEWAVEYLTQAVSTLRGLAEAPRTRGPQHATASPAQRSWDTQQASACYTAAANALEHLLHAAQAEILALKSEAA